MQYNFDQAFQEKALAFYLRDGKFATMMDDLINPEYFEEEPWQHLAAAQQLYLKKYGEGTDLAGYIHWLKQCDKKNLVRGMDLSTLKPVIKKLYKLKLAGRAQIEDELGQFARLRALEEAGEVLFDAIAGQDADEVEAALARVDKVKTMTAITEHEAITLNEDATGRADRRKLMASTSLEGGITTGVPELDTALPPWGGWARQSRARLRH